MTKATVLIEENHNLKHHQEGSLQKKFCLWLYSE